MNTPSSSAEMEWMMKVQDVLLKATAEKITWWVVGKTTALRAI